MTTEVIIKRWGSSLGIVIPKEVVEDKMLKEKDKVFLNIVRKADIEGDFGSLKRKLSGQKFKDIVREGWPS